MASVIRGSGQSTLGGNLDVEGVLTYEDVTNVDSVGIITARSGVRVPDGQKILLGTGNDLEIYHDGSQNAINSYTSNPLNIISNGNTTIKTNNNDNMAVFKKNNAVELYYDNSKKFETTSTGVSFTGDLANASLTNAQVAAISASTSDTAVDVFVYDTSKDSDGGEWRKRTQHTSWYNETLNTSTRGSRKEFPSVAVIVAESAKVTIYDGDDPDIPMWMVFETNSSDMLVSNGINAAVMLNGILSVVRNTPIIMVNFVADKSNNISPSSETNYQGNIEQRNDGLGFTGDISARRAVANGGNDVAMTVLPNAPIDDATGLPVPTIAVGTQAGVSIIRDTGDIVDLYVGASSYDTVKKISFTDDNKVAYTVDGVSQSRAFRVDSIPSGDFEVTTNQLQKGNGEEFYVTADYGLSSGDLAYSNVNNSQVNSLVKRNVAHQAGLSKIEKENDGPKHAFVTSSFNTGWMHGDIKGAFLSDTDTTNVTGSELVTNGTFDSDVSGWTAVNGTITYSSGTAVVNRTGGAGPVAYQTITTVVGETYVLSGTVNSTGTGDRGDIRAYSDNGSTMLVNAMGTDNQTVTVSGTFTATTTTTYIYFVLDTTGTCTFDNVSVRIAEEDRSVNNNGLQVFGTVNKQPVVSGADLVGYSNFGSSNYLQQPYNSDLDFGTGDYSIILWAYRTVNATTIMVDKSRQNGTQTNRLSLYFNNSNGFVELYEANSTTTTVVSDTALQLNRWTQIAYTRRNSTASLYMDGKLVGTVAAMAGNVGDSNHKLVIGNGYNYTYGWGGSLALVRISGTAPTAEQIKKMYEDEKHLYQENAKCTLYGSSDAVTALAYDEDEEILYAGTSSGRSDFQGLCRINNTTTAVTTAISASNDLVAEQ